MALHQLTRLVHLPGPQLLALIVHHHGKRLLEQGPELNAGRGARLRGRGGFSGSGGGGGACCSCTLVRGGVRLLLWNWALRGCSALRRSVRLRIFLIAWDRVRWNLYRGNRLIWVLEVE